MTYQGYYAIEDLNLNASQRQTLVEALRKLGPASDPQPARLCHWRTRLDGQAAIFEAAFNENNLTVEAFKRRLGTIFGVSWVTIGHSTQSVTFDSLPTPVVTFSRTGTDYLRMALFGGPAASWEESRLECQAYLKDHQDEWESEE